MRCQRCGAIITDINKRDYKVLDYEGEEFWCVDCIEQYTYYCEGCGSYCADTMPPDHNGICPFCIDDGYFEED